MKNEALIAAKAAFEIEAAEIIRAQEVMDWDVFAKAVEVLAKAERIGTAGCGHSGICCTHFAHSLCCIERPARFISPAEAVHGGMGFIQKGDVMVLASRGGKTALWCGATDKRIALTISSCSGCTGAAITRGKEGEHVKNINGTDWFCQNYQHYNDAEEFLPVDQHMLLAMMAPRAVYVSSAQLDSWADPSSEFLSCRMAGEAFELLGKKGLVTEDEEPVLDKMYHEGRIGYHMHGGPHRLLPDDWIHYMDYADKLFQK